VLSAAQRNRQHLDPRSRLRVGVWLGVARRRRRRGPHFFSGPCPLRKRCPASFSPGGSRLFAAVCVLPRGELLPGRSSLLRTFKTGCLGSGHPHCGVVSTRGAFVLSTQRSVLKIIFHRSILSHDSSVLCLLICLTSQKSELFPLPMTAMQVYYGFACFPDLRRTYLFVTAALLVVGLTVSLADSCSPAAETATATAPSDVKGVTNSASSADASPQGTAATATTTHQPPPSVGTTIAPSTAAPPSSSSSSSYSNLVQRLRTFTFASFVVLGVAGALQWRFLVKAEARALFFPKVACSLAFYGLGFGFYASHWPERRWPGAFDYALHSHQLWHVCVVAAVGVWYYLCLATTTTLGNEGCAAFVGAVSVGEGGVPFGLRASHGR